MNASDLVRRHVLQNQTSLVNLLFEHFSDFMDEISNQYSENCKGVLRECF